MKSSLNNETPLHGELKTIPQLARLFGLSQKQIRDYVAEGLPVAIPGKRPNPHQINTADFFHWCIARRDADNRLRKKSDSNSATDDVKEKLNGIRIQKAELELKKATGTLIDFRELVPFVQDKLLGFRQALYQIPPEMREQFGSSAGAFCERRIRETLNHLAGAAGLGGVEAHAREIAKPR